MASLSHEEKIVDMMGFYQNAFPVQSKINEAGLAIYGKVLSRYTIPQLKAAMDRIIETNKYFPSIAEIRETVDLLTEHVATDGKGIPDAGEAFEEMLYQARKHSVFLDKWEFSTPEIERAVKRFGKNEVLYMPESEIGIARAQFRKIYEEELRRISEHKLNNAALSGAMGSLVDKLAGNSSRVFVLEG